MNHSLQSDYPEVAREWDRENNGSLQSDMVTPRSGRKVWWVCPKGHHYQSIIANRTKGVGCPFCAGKAVLPGFNDLSQKNL